MTRPKAFGSFVLRHGKLFRTSAYIQWGKSSKSLGAVLMLNPGSADFGRMSPDLEARLKNYGAAMGAIRTDPTMEQLIQLVERIYEDRSSLGGRLQIYNLFHLQETNAAQAITTFESLVNRHKLTITQSLVTVDELKTHPWILVGWGLSYNRQWKNLKAIKDQWLEHIRLSGIPKFGIMNQRGDYCHPCPLITSERPIILKELVHVFTKTVKPLLPSEKNVLARYTLLRWNNQRGDEARFIVRNNRTGTQSLVTPRRPQDTVWFHYDLAADESVEEWTTCDDKSVDDLKFINFYKE
ncbi:DUF1643 domain-containing protein [Sporolactobacillus sp. THM7-7]|nr:DUF1643 domain-containing protein [Sporolactobacillus sp. THM7-7]